MIRFRVRSFAISTLTGGIQGAGEAIRGNVNTFADNVTNTSDGRSEATAQRGEDEMKTGIYQSTHAGAGVTPKDTAGEKLNRQI